MNKRLILAAAAAFALSGAGVAQARDNINWSVSIGDPFVGAVISNGHRYGPAYGYAAPVYIAPPVVYAPPPRVVYEQAHVYAPYGYVPYEYAQPRHGRRAHGYGQRSRYDREDHRDWHERKRDSHEDYHGRDNHWQRR